MEENVPAEIIDTILGMLATRHVISASLVCTRWAAVARGILRSRSTFRRVFPLASPLSNRRDDCSSSPGASDCIADTQQNQLPPPGASQAAAAINGDTLVVSGGGTYLTGSPQNPLATQTFVEVRRSLWTWNFDSAVWVNQGAEDDVHWPAVTEHSIVVHGGSAFIFGGTNRTKYINSVHRIVGLSWRNSGPSVPPSHVKSSSPLSRPSPRAIIEVPPPADSRRQQHATTAAMTTAAEEPPERSAHTAVSMGNSMVVFGGWNGVSTFDDLWEWSFDDRRWTRLLHAGCPKPRRTHCAAVLGDSMFVFGGYNDGSAGSGGDVFNDLHCFDPVEGWRILHDGSGFAPEPRGRCTMVADELHEKLLVFGGWDRKETFLGDLWEFSISDRHWTRIRTNFCDLHGGGLCQHSAVVHDRKLYIYGGYSSQTGQFSNSLYSVNL